MDAEAVDDLLLGRRSVRLFRDAPLDEADLRRALEVAVWAPNHRRTEPWRFIVVRAETQHRLADRAGELKRLAHPRPDGPEAASVAARAREELVAAAALLAVVQRLAEDPAVAMEDYAACALATDRALLALWARGVAGRWSTGGITRDEQTLTLLGVGSKERLVFLSPLGYPAAVPTRPAPHSAESRTTWLN